MISRQEELDAIQRFEEAGKIQKLEPVDTIDRAIDRVHLEKANRARARIKRAPQRLHSWTRAKKQKPEEIVEPIEEEVAPSDMDIDWDNPE